MRSGFPIRALPLALPLCAALAMCSPLDGLSGQKEEPTGPDAGDDVGDASMVDAGDAGDAVDGPDASVDGAVDASILGCAAPGLVAFWEADEPSGQTVADCTSNHLDGVVVGSVQRVAGHRGLALSLEPLPDGGGNGVNLASPSKLNVTGAITLSAWINVPVATSGRILTKDSGGQFGWTLSVTNAPDIRFAVPVTASMVLTASSPLLLAQWVHVAGVYEPSTSVRIYVDGVRRDEVTTGVPASIYNATSNNASLGMRGSPSCCTPAALVDDLRIFNRALTDDEITALAQ